MQCPFNLLQIVLGIVRYFRLQNKKVLPMPTVQPVEQHSLSLSLYLVTTLSPKCNIPLTLKCITRADHRLLSRLHNPYATSVSIRVSLCAWESGILSFRAAWTYLPSLRHFNRFREVDANGSYSWSSHLYLKKHKINDARAPCEFRKVLK